jgi:hypothetical protein
MPIPDFDHNLVLPPHVGDHSVNAANMSPYPCTSLELCAKLGTSPERQAILRGFFELREILRQLGVSIGFQWINGSFTEDVENDPRRKNPPNDIDVVTFYRPLPALPAPLPQHLATAIPILGNRAATKTRFRVDHFMIPMDPRSPEFLIDQARYWFGLFSHRRGDDVWKGMLKISLDTPADDLLAIGNLPTVAP